MSTKFPIISVTGSSGAGTTSVRHTFEHIFRRENVNAAFVQGDAFHRYDREEMEAAMDAAATRGNQNFSHFGEEANLFAELEELFRCYSETGRGRTRVYVHDEEEARNVGAPMGCFTPWAEIPPDTDLLLYEGLHGAVITKDVNVARHADLK
ncbi:MAG: phosphoribulokinase, partial [Hyphomicrobiaceae bacterium]|nr:phosphoribulokinase [Hyphomicrobiaceae bacterium]